MVTFSAVFSWVNSTISDCLCVALLVLVFHRKLYRRLVFFTAYIFFLAVWNAVTFWRSHTALFPPLVWFYVFWSSEFLLSMLRLLTIAEVSKRFLRGYPAVWLVASRLLAAVALVLLSWTALSTAHNVHQIRLFILVGDQRLECTQAVLLLLLLIIGAYYRLQIPPLYRLILVGIGIYSSIQLADNQLGILHAMPPNSVFDYIRRGSITISLVIWAYALSRWAAIPDPPPELIPQAVYDEHSAGIHNRLRSLNDHLAGLLRP